MHMHRVERFVVMWWQSLIQFLLAAWRALLFFPRRSSNNKTSAQVCEADVDDSSNHQDSERLDHEYTRLPKCAPSLSVHECGFSTAPRRRADRESSTYAASPQNTPCSPRTCRRLSSYKLWGAVEDPSVEDDTATGEQVTPQSHDLATEEEWSSPPSPDALEEGELPGGDTTRLVANWSPGSLDSSVSSRISLCWQDLRGKGIQEILASFKAFKAKHPHWRGDRLLSEVITEKLRVVAANSSPREDSSNESVQKRRSGFDLSFSRLSLPSFDSNGVSDEIISFGQSGGLLDGTSGSLARREQLASALFTLLENEGLTFSSDVTLFNVVVEACVGLGSMQHLNLVMKFLKTASLKHLDSFSGGFSEDGSSQFIHEEIRRFLFGHKERANEMSSAVLLDLVDPLKAARLREARRLYLVSLVEQSSECVSTEINGVNLPNLFVPSLQSYGLLIRGFGHSKDVRVLRFLWNHAELYAGFEPESVTYGCMLDGLIQSSAVNEGMDLFDHMKSQNKIQPNTIMYSTLIKGFARAKEHERALDLYNEMVENDVPVNTVTFNSLVNACARVGAMRDAGFVLDKMLEAGISPDLVTFSTVVKGYCVRGEVDRAYSLLISLKKKGIQPDGILYNTLLDGCVRAKKFALCEQVWTSMVSDNVIPSNFTLTIFIKLFGRLGRLDRIFELVDEFPGRYGFAVNGHVYTCLMSACISNQRFDHVYDIFQKMLASRASTGFPDAKSFETALGGLLKGGFFKEGTTVLKLAFGVENELYPVELLNEDEASIGYRLDPSVLKSWVDSMERYRQQQLLGAVHSQITKALELSANAGNKTHSRHPNNKGRKRYVSSNVGTGWHGNSDRRHHHWSDTFFSSNSPMSADAEPFTPT
eukprot:Gregarina_sp_Poly_1__2013@NODE_1529_length_3921_cov_123_027244_g248_i3_p1_GENE_NODE_1529_length_3921_cov_123_027244_g248_i3NODE_1529_length_3921_cov_123_027244_g248_i3_p1_ORF_typecomplete_len875_score132_17PPR_long/PF17177_4/1e02PPR_long/PF17177_4/0_0006PPR_long/PF17177_4/4e39PPR_long/PF17177_4/5e23PPR_2/PF13041_6/1_8e03PPR_2/PF13041_6/2_1e03PPR_2/PF13041_6/1_9e10PPR_2/PF13041_6/7e15PPR_2/PF13041_6/1_2e13PPR_2/PF13041_6/1_3e12PPR_2/PF13041_6/2_3e06PPR_2/PF13041_6/0_01PPR_3/PF13812_6/53PPR_3/PF13